MFPLPPYLSVDHAALPSTSSSSSPVGLADSNAFTAFHPVIIAHRDCTVQACHGASTAM